MNKNFLTLTLTSMLFCVYKGGTYKMQIGEFARLCDTKISVLRHYDKAGILLPVFIDRFSGYRYYDEKQKQLFLKIKELLGPSNEVTVFRFLAQ